MGQRSVQKKGEGRRNQQRTKQQIVPDIQDMPNLDNKKQSSSQKPSASAAAPAAAKTLADLNAEELKIECEALKVSVTGSEAELRTRVENAGLLKTTTTVQGTPEERAEAAEKLATSLATFSGMALVVEVEKLNLLKSLEAVMRKGGKSTAVARVGAVAVTHGLLSKVGKAALPLLLPLLHALLALSGDKAKAPKVAAAQCVEALMSLASVYAPYMIIPELLKPSKSWQANEARMKLVASLCKSAPEATASCLNDAIPAVAKTLHDLKKQVKKAAGEALSLLCALCVNEDVVPLVPTLISALERPKEIPECVQTLASTTFVQTVDGPTLAIMSPILVGGFAVRTNGVTKRASARIVENMVKLVEDRRSLAENFLPKILPLIEKAHKVVSDPEAREVCQKAKDMLVAKAQPKAGETLIGSVSDRMEQLVAELKVVGVANHDAPEAMVYITFCAGLIAAMADLKQFEPAVWTDTLGPYLSCVTDQYQAVIDAILVQVDVDVVDEDEKELDDGVEELCNCEFSLAYGNKVLLRKTKLRLQRGYRYGLIGQNDSGKTSLMRAIADHRVEGFPEEHELRTVFVETDIQGELSDLSVLDYIMADKLLKDMNITREAMTKTLNDVGFNADSPADVNTCVGALSGGWKMKLALARAMLLNADILLLDEPTNHLDSYNVKWVEDYLLGLDGVTCVMVSHDSGFLNRCTTHIIQIENFALSFFKGNLEAFVKKTPGANAFFELKTEKFKFAFPPPSRLSGVNSKGKAIMKMTNISFTYPGAPKPQLKNVTIQVSLGSRVACVGVNGAGKSTMIKLLTGELEPDEGSGAVWTHANMQYGYIAQHAFHHIEQHLDKTANEYVCWRYRHGNDREALNKVTQIISEEEQKAMDKPITYSTEDPVTGLKVKKKAVIKRLTESRRVNKLLKEQEYEAALVSAAGTIAPKVWVLRSILEKAGWMKVLKHVDDRINIREASFARPLTKENVRKHFLDVGLEEEFSSHMRIGALSGGQKVKVVLGACLWNRPHVLILDEPTNYLDRDSLGALAGAIREFEGGVVMITHNSQFCDDLCPQVWHLENNTLNVKGDASWMSMEKLGDEKKQEEESVDRFGNTIVRKKLKSQMTNKQRKALKKAKLKRRKARIKAGLDASDTDTDSE